MIYTQQSFNPAEAEVWFRSGAAFLKGMDLPIKIQSSRSRRMV